MVPSLLFAAITGAVLVVVCLVLHCRCDRDDDTLRNLFGFTGVIAGLAIVVFLISAACLEQTHWDNTCHKMGGKLTESGDCWTGHKINVP